MPTPKKITRSPKRVRLASRDNAVVTTISFAQPVHQALQMAAIKRNWTLTTVVQAACADWLKAHEGGPR
jgi:hypothetical protein